MYYYTALYTRFQEGKGTSVQFFEGTVVSPGAGGGLKFRVAEGPADRPGGQGMVSPRDVAAGEEAVGGGDDLQVALAPMLSLTAFGPHRPWET